MCGLLSDERIGRATHAMSVIKAAVGVLFNYKLVEFIVGAVYRGALFNRPHRCRRDAEAADASDHLAACNATRKPPHRTSAHILKLIRSMTSSQPVSEARYIILSIKEKTRPTALSTQCNLVNVFVTPVLATCSLKTNYTVSHKKTPKLFW